MKNKIVKCKTCKRDFTQEAGYELDDYGKVVKSSIYYHDECPFCIHKIDERLITIILAYQDGIVTNEELINKLSELRNK